jgi:hypothetical protein
VSTPCYSFVTADQVTEQAATMVSKEFHAGAFAQDMVETAEQSQPVEPVLTDTIGWKAWDDGGGDHRPIPVARRSLAR